MRLSGDDSFSSSPESSSIDLSSRSNLALDIRRSMYSTVETIQNPMVVQVATARSVLMCRRIMEIVASTNVMYGKSSVIEGFPVVESCMKGNRIPTSLQLFHFCDNHANI